jgi:hypothetical protein
MAFNNSSVTDAFGVFPPSRNSYPYSRPDLRNHIVAFGLLSRVSLALWIRPKDLPFSSAGRKRNMFI